MVTLLVVAFASSLWASGGSDLVQADDDVTAAAIAALCPDGLGGDAPGGSEPGAASAGTCAPAGPGVRGSVAVGADCPSGHTAGARDPVRDGHITAATEAMAAAVVSCFGRGTGGVGCYHPRSGRYEHPRGRACDFMVTGDERRRGDAMAAWLQANAEQLNILYVIWYRRIWEPSMGDVPHEQWSPYSGASDHTDHVHASVRLMPGDPGWAECPHSTCSGPAYGDPG